MDGKAVIQWGEKYGLYVGDRLIDSFGQLLGAV